MLCLDLSHCPRWRHSDFLTLWLPLRRPGQTQAPPTSVSLCVTAARRQLGLNGAFKSVLGLVVSVEVPATTLNFLPFKFQLNLVSGVQSLQRRSEASATFSRKSYFIWSERIPTLQKSKTAQKMYSAKQLMFIIATYKVKQQRSVWPEHRRAQQLHGNRGVCLLRRLADMRPPVSGQQ